MMCMTSRITNGAMNAVTPAPLTFTIILNLTFNPYPVDIGHKAVEFVSGVLPMTAAWKRRTVALSISGVAATLILLARKAAELVQNARPGNRPGAARG
jgi:hypothetical protein